MITEAIEAASSKEAALYNLAAQYAKDETAGVRDMYESAAVARGASFDETERAAEIGRLASKYTREGRPSQRHRAYELLRIDGLNLKEAVATFAMLTREVSR